ncbi:uncharacterized protein LOC122647335 [Telopea speciosissima]|uniref:uncharacterized protein LOC122647335 n=1 Tax=Telopea speciosissima TaxID=54955 RepID=UPI001CC7784F|nr:uncharacterized protein LOC122647335 [Telopea speciosissima]
METTFAESNGKGNSKGNDNSNGKSDGKGNSKGNGNDEGDGKGSGNKKDNSTDYTILSKGKNGHERALCLGAGKCYLKTLQCPSQCLERKPKKNKKMKGCFIDCSKCESTCKYRKPKCNGYGSICYDPRFVGGDGVMFYFHGATGGDFALVSDNDLQINAHFIGSRPTGRTRDFTWVQALSVMFDSHTLVLAAKRVSHWNDNVEALIVHWDGERIQIPTDEEAEWRSSGGDRKVVIERTDETNSVRVTVAGLVEMDVKVTPIGAKENQVHNYQLPSDNAFAHLETQFRFKSLSEYVEGVLGQTYRPDYVSPVKIGVPMPMMGGEDKYRTPSLLSPLCKLCRFKSLPSTANTAIKEVAQY